MNTRREIVVAVGIMAAIFFAVVLYWTGWGSYQTRTRDAERVTNVGWIRSSLLAARAGAVVLKNCEASGASLRDCNFFVKIEDVTERVLPREHLKPDQKAEQNCDLTSVAPCAWVIETAWDTPTTLDQFQIRFFLEQDWHGLAGGRTHVMDEAGVIY